MQDVTGRRPEDLPEAVAPVARQLPRGVVGQLVLRHSGQDGGGCAGEARLTHQTHPRLKGGRGLDRHLRRDRFCERLDHMTSFNKGDGLRRTRELSAETETDVLPVSSEGCS